MNKRCIKLLLISLGALLALSAYAGEEAVLRSPHIGVLCDRSFCANDEGISRVLTERYLGTAAAEKLFLQGDFDLTEFTFSGGIFCDVKERICLGNRYYGPDGKHSGPVSEKYTKLLFK